jgi:predicted RecA/RadA family phage recombinase
MAKSKARFLSELLGSTGLVKRSKSALAGADEVLDLDTIPTIPNSKLANATISIAGHSTALGGSVTLNTGNIGEHTNYKYFTDARARAAVSVSGDLAYNSSTGVFSFTERTDAEVRGLISATGSLSYNSTTGVMSFTMPAQNTSNVTEGSNLYFTNARARSAISATGSLSYNSTTGVMSFSMPAQNTSNITEGTNLYYTNARADARIAAASTSDLSEGTNLYYTDARADARVALIVDSAPGTLNTLNELAAALGDDANFSTTITNSIAAKLPLAGGTMTGTLAMGANAITGTGNITTGADSYITFGPNSTWANSLRVGGNGRAATGTAMASVATTNGNLHLDGASSRGIYLNHYAGTAGTLFGNGASATVARMDSGGQLYKSDSTTNPYWNAANDGSGSGLDADLLDGLQGSSYLRSDTPSIISVASSSGDLLRLANSTSGQFIQIGFQQNDTDGMHHRAYLKTWKGSTSASGNVDLIVRGPGGSTTSDVLSLRSGNASPTWRGQAIWNAGNDGSGSGLDADLLDGVQGANYGRTDVSTIYGAGAHSNYFRRNNTTNYTNAPLIVESYGGSSTTTGVGFHISGSIGRYLFMNSSGDVFWNSTASKIWHASNDGSGSGLDADLLDGQHGSYYAPASHGHSYLPLTGGTVSGTTSFSYLTNTGGSKLEVMGGADGNQRGIYIWDTSDANWGIYMAQAGANKSLAGGTACNSLDGRTSHHIRFRTYGQDAIRGWIFENNLEAAKVSITSDTGKIYSTGDHYVGSNVVWHAGNDGSGSGLDADLLDGTNGGRYLKTGAGDSVSGWWISGARNGNSGSPQVYFSHSSGYGQHINTYNTSGGVYALEIHNNVKQLFAVYNDGAVLANGGNAVWHAGNDGSGSGLDADLLDGNQAAAFPLKTGTTFTGQVNVSYSAAKFIVGGTSALDISDAERPNITLTGGMYPHMTIDARDGNAATNTNHGPVFSFVSRLGTSGYRRWAMGTAAYNAGALSFGYYDNNANPHYGMGGNAGYTTTGSKMWLATNGQLSTTSQGVLWGATNDGSGSGLDADTVDGVQASSIVQLTGTQTITGQKYFQSNRNTTSNSPALQAYSTGNTGAIMSFHRGGYYAINMGLDSDNVFRIGGWSAPNNLFVMNMAGDLTMAGDIRADSFLYNSDRAFKTNIKPIKNALSTVLSLSGVSYTLKKSGKNTTGFIAQEVEKVLPDMVDGDEGEKGVNYGQMVALLTEAMREQQNLIVSLQKEIQELKDATK